MFCGVGLCFGRATETRVLVWVARPKQGSLFQSSDPNNHPSFGRSTETVSLAWGLGTNKTPSFGRSTETISLLWRSRD